MSPIGTGRPTSHLGPDLEHHLAVCAGEFCARCDNYLPGSAETGRGLRLCLSCWPDPSVPWTKLHASLQWGPNRPWSLNICHPTAHVEGETDRNRIAVWLVLHDRAECTAVLDRYLCSLPDRELFEQLGDYAGHCTVGLFVGPRRVMALAEATRQDPRTWYDKVHGSRPTPAR